MIEALILALALQAPAPLTDGTPDDKAAALATLDLAYGCMLTLSAYETGAGYAGAADKMGSGLPPPVPAWAAAVHMDGAQGRGCRVRYAGPKADAVWAADAKFLHGLPAADAGNGCTFVTDTPTRLAGVCASTGDAQDGRPSLTRRGDVALERTGAGVVTATVTDPRP